MSKIRVLVAADGRGVHGALLESIRSAPDLELLGVAGDVDAALAAAHEHRPDVILIYVGTHDGAGVVATRQVLAKVPGARVVYLSAPEDEVTALEILEAGAVGYLVRDATEVEILEAVHRAARGQLTLAASLAAACLRDLLSKLEAHRGSERVLRANEKRLRNVLEATVDALVVINPRGEIDLVNGQTERLFGYARSELVGQSLEVLIPERSRAVHSVHRTEFKDHPATRPMGTGLQLAGRRKDGSEFPVDISLSPFQTEDGQLIVAMVCDITQRIEAERAIAAERRRAQAALEEALAELRARNEAISAMSEQLWQHSKLATMGELAASVAHELNNPMATISLRIESVLAGLAPDDPHRQPLQVVESELERMSRLVANLLQFSRRSTAQISTVDVGAEIEKSLELIEYRLRGQGVRVVRELAADLPAIHADRQQLRQLFLNLLTNAGDAMLTGGTLTIRLSGEAAAAAGPVKAICIEIEDTGTGIAPENLPQVMEPFFTTKPEGKGTGLGLLICSRVVQGHGGRLELRSELGKGTTARVVLPLGNGANGKSIRSTALEDAGGDGQK